MEYQRIAAAGLSRHPVQAYLRVGRGTVRGVAGGLVFGTLLGPEATGPVVAAFGCGCPGLVFLVSWLHRAHTFACVGCVVWGCCLRTT